MGASALTLLASAPAFAQPRPPTAARCSAASDTDATLAAEPRALLETLRRSEAAGHEPSRLPSIATLQFRLGHTQDAIETLSLYLRECPDAADRLSAEVLLDSLRRRLASGGSNGTTTTEHTLIAQIDTAPGEPPAPTYASAAPPTTSRRETPLARRYRSMPLVIGAAAIGGIAALAGIALSIATAVEFDAYGRQPSNPRRVLTGNLAAGADLTLGIAVVAAGVMLVELVAFPQRPTAEAAQPARASLRLAPGGLLVRF